MKLWAINKWLRWTGFRLIVGVAKFALRDEERGTIKDALLMHSAKLGSMCGQRCADQINIADRLLRELAEENAPTTLKLEWVGLPGSEGWKRWEA